MQLRILGSGTILTSHIKNCSGYIINDELLLDCGPGVWRALGVNGIKNVQIKYIAFSHFHADHISDLSPILLERYLDAASKLVLLGPVGLKKWFNDYSKLFGSWMQKLPIEIVELDSEFIIDNYKIKVLPTAHTDNSICFRIEDSENKALFYSGDSGENENIKKLAKNTDLAILEASNLPSTKIEGHLTPQLAAKIARQANVKKLVLTHLYPEVYNSDALAEAEKYFDKEILIAEDNLILRI